MENKAKEENVEQEQTFVKKKKTNISSVIKTTWKIFEKILMIAIILISAIIITQKVTDNEKAFFGYRLFRVQTGSMIPVYNVGDVIIVKEKAIDKIAIGDDVTYWGTSGAMKGKLVTHRVIDIEEIDGQKAFHTQGVANTVEDPIVFAEQINGVVQGKIYVLTWICSLLSNRYILYFCVIMPVTIFIFFSIIKANMKRLKEYK